MEMSIFEMGGKTYTRFKIGKKNWDNGFFNRYFEDIKPSKENSRFIYFEVEGDFINKKLIKK